MERDGMLYKVEVRLLGKRNVRIVGRRKVSSRGGMLRVVRRDQEGYGVGPVDMFPSPIWQSDGRLESAFEPESGRLLGGVEPALPKTYSTRRGPLFLYYEEMAMTSSVLSSCPSGSEDNRKRWASHHSRQEVELQLNTLRDLTGAILAYGNKQLREEGEGQPVLPLPSSQESYYPPIKPSYPRLPTKGWTPFRSTWRRHLEQLTDDPELCRGHVKIPCPTPAAGNGQAVSPRPYRQPQVPLPPIPERGERPCSLKTASVDSSWRSSQLSHINYYGGYLGGAQQGRKLKQGSAKDNTSLDPSVSRFHFPPVFSGSLVSLDPERDSGGRKPRSPGGLGGRRDSEQFLPLIHEAYVSSEGPAQTQPERLTQTHLEPQAHPEKPGPRRLLLSVLLPHIEEEEMQTVGVHHKQSEEDRGEPDCGEMIHRRERTRRGGGGGGGGRGRGLPEKGSKQTGPEQDGLSLLEPGEEHAVPLAVFAPLAGRLRGPGKQSSMAIYKDRSDVHAPWDPSDPGRAMVRGSLPLELR
ncbi:unnamed protein product, partial [Coregonus sp. 'balchen']